MCFTCLWFFWTYFKHFSEGVADFKSEICLAPSGHGSPISILKKPNFWRSDQIMCYTFFRNLWGMVDLLVDLIWRKKLVSAFRLNNDPSLPPSSYHYFQLFYCIELSSPIPSFNTSERSTFNRYFIPRAPSLSCFSCFSFSSNPQFFKSV